MHYYKTYLRTGKIYGKDTESKRLLFGLLLTVTSGICFLKHMLNSATGGMDMA